MLARQQGTNLHTLRTLCRLKTGQQEAPSMEWGGSAGGRRLGGGGGRGGLSPGVVPLRVRGDGGRGRLGCLRLSRRPPIAPGSPTCIAPVVCSPPIWSPGGRSPQPPALQARSDAPRETREGSRRRWPSGLLWPLSPPAGRPRVSSAYIAVPDDRPAHVRRKTSHPRAHPPSAAGLLPRQRRCLLAITKVRAWTQGWSHGRRHESSIDMSNNDVGKESAQKFMKQTGVLKADTLYFAS